MKISNETKVGILAAFAIIILILGFNFLKGNDLFTKSIKLSSKYPDVEGLNKGNPVMLYGLAVGRVDDIVLTNDSRKKVLVKYHVNDDVILPMNSIAKIVSLDILNSKAIQLIPGNSMKNIADNDTLIGDVELSLSSSVSKVVAPVKEKIESLLGAVDTVVSGFNDILNEQTKRDLRSSFHSIRESVMNIENVTGHLDSFAKNETGRIKTILTDVQSITSNFKNNNATLSRAIENFGAISDSLRAANLKQTLLEANKAMTQINEIINKVQDGKGSLGMLLKDDKLYNNLEASSKDLDLLVKDIKANPKHYVHFSVFGGKDKKDKKAAVVPETK